MDEDADLHTIEPIVTPGQYRNGERLRVPGGWLYWVEVTGGTYVSSFVPDPQGASRKAPVTR